MNLTSYPDSVNIMSHVVDVKVLDRPIVINEGTTEQILGAAYFDPTQGSMFIWHNPEKPSIGYTSLFHEMIEAADCYGDLQLNHTQITTLAGMMCQMWQSLPNYVEGTNVRQ